MASQKPELVDHLSNYTFLESEEATRRKNSVLKRAAICAVLTIGLLTWGFFLSSERFNPKTDGAFAFAFVTFIGFLVFAWRARDYDEARAKDLDKILPMLQDDAQLRTAVKTWIEKRPLLIRDLNFLKSLIPTWKDRKQTSAFGASLANASQEKPSPNRNND